MSTGLVELPFPRNDQAEAFIYGILRHALETHALDSVQSRIAVRIAATSRSPKAAATSAGRARVQRGLWRMLLNDSEFRKALADGLRERRAFAPIQVP